jgi:hypothetical protein
MLNESRDRRDTTCTNTGKKSEVGWRSGGKADGYVKAESQTAPRYNIQYVQVKYRPSVSIHCIKFGCVQDGFFFFFLNSKTSPHEVEIRGTTLPPHRQTQQQKVVTYIPYTRINSNLYHTLWGTVSAPNSLWQNKDN